MSRIVIVILIYHRHNLVYHISIAFYHPGLDTNEGTELVIVLHISCCNY
jgi:hypothetical protein